MAGFKVGDTFPDKGTHASRPASPSSNPSFYSCTDHNKIYRWNGTAWSDWAVLGSAATFTVQDENTDVSTAVTRIDFQGAGVTASAGTGEVVVTIPGGGGAGDTAWTAVTFQNGWVNYDTASYPAAGFRKDGNGFVHLRGLVKSGTFQAAIFTLPAGYRPAGNKGYPVMSNGGLGQVNINPAGVVSLNISPASSTASVFLDGITFLAEA